MPRIQGVDLPPDKPTHVSLRYLRGIGPTLALRLCDQAGIDPQRRAKELNDDEIARIAAILDREYLVEGELTRVRKFGRRDVDRWMEWPRHADPLYSPYDPLRMSGPVADAWYDDLVRRQAQQPYAADTLDGQNRPTPASVCPFFQCRVAP